jgi:hypothetical protein
MTQEWGGSYDYGRGTAVKAELAANPQTQRWLAPGMGDTLSRRGSRHPRLYEIVDDVYHRSLGVSSHPIRYLDNVREIRDWLGASGNANVDPDSGALWVIQHGDTTRVVPGSG